MTPELINFKKISDERGALVALEELKNIPFLIKRTYYSFDNLQNSRRGFHAHKQLQQIAICVKGACSFLLDDSQSSCDIRLDSPTQGLYIGINIWHEMYDFSEDCVLLLIASDFYDESDYIRNYDEFVCYARKSRALADQKSELQQRSENR